VAVSFGAACSTGTTEPSHVLTALALPRDVALTAVRFGIGRWTTGEEIDYTVGKIARVVAGLRPSPAPA
jgi:cysteine desulfurase